MNCREIQQDILLYYSDELSLERKGVVENHLSVCPNCAEFAAGISKITRNISGMPRRKNEIDVWPRVRQSIELKHFSVPRFVLVPVMATMVLGVLVTNMFFKPSTIISKGDTEIVNDMEFLVDYELWENLDALENFAS